MYTNIVATTHGHYRFLFTVLIITAIMHGSSFGQANPHKTSSYQLKVHVGGSYNAPLDKAGELWERYPTAGVYIDLPTFSRSFLFRGEFEGGYAETFFWRMPVSHQSVYLVYDGLTLGGRLTLMPKAGVMNMMIYPSGEISFDSDPFAPSENEFGFSAGADIVWKNKYLIVSIPLAITTIFSTPDEFIFGSVSIRAGREF